jgi:hypothetical protein
MARPLRKVRTVLRTANPSYENYRFGFIVLDCDNKITLETFWDIPGSDEFEIRQFKVEAKCLTSLMSQGFVTQQKSAGSDLVTFWFTAKAYERLEE